MSYLVVLLCGVLFRLDGWGKGDSFLPCKPFTRPGWQTGGINYTRYLIGVLIALYTQNWWYLATYTIVNSIPYGEKHSWMQFGVTSWFVYGLLLGGASLNWAVSLWVGCLVVVAKVVDLDQAWFEVVVLGMSPVVFIAFK